MNPDQRQLELLHGRYLRCIRKTLKNFVTENSADFSATGGSSSDSGSSSTNDNGGYAKEWCTTEKAAYFDFMSKNFKTEYENILRIEANSF